MQYFRILAVSTLITF